MTAKPRCPIGSRDNIDAKPSQGGIGIALGQDVVCGRRVYWHARSYVPAAFIRPDIKEE